MIIGASSFAAPLPELRKEVESIELYIPKLGLYSGYRLVKENVDKLHDLLSTYSIPTSIHAPYFGETPKYPVELVVDTAHMGKTQFRIMEENISLAHELGSSVVVVHPGKVRGGRESSFMQMVENLRQLSAKAGDCGVVLGLENKEGTDLANLCCTAEELLRAVEEVNSRFLRITFDTGHANLTYGGDMGGLRGFVKKISDHVVHVHVHDNTGTTDEKYFGDMHFAPGEGNIDFTILRELHFDGVYNLEVFSIEDVRKGKVMLKSLM
ncbi:MAG: sugar phosphate isomerase/epimerase [Candidatus Methanoperedens sp.]|nr:sugar phosphate isomerase/epimerase [Candidatus Methanoperedens sp.]